MRFLPYPEDPRPITGDAATYEQLKVFTDLPAADVETTFNDFMDTLVALPNHVPRIVDVTPMPARQEEGHPSGDPLDTATRVHLFIRYRLIGTTPPPDL